jgi:hypothetical protein
MLQVFVSQGNQETRGQVIHPINSAVLYVYFRL